MLVLAKPPRAGVAKTRLAAGLGEERAAALARAFFEDTWAAARELSWAKPVLVTTEPDAAEWRALGVRRSWPQSEGDLGARLAAAYRRGLDGGAPAAIAVGTDSPGLPRERFDAAREALERADAVIGPAADGGFYLLGMRRIEPDLLDGLPWSRGDTCDRLVARLAERGYSIERLPQEVDLDRPEDLGPFLLRLDRGELRAPATARALASGRRSGPRISVIVPTLDEARRIGPALDRLLAPGGWHEVIVSDGGSADGTPGIVRRRAGVRLVEGPRGRGRQLNRGARGASGDVLLFLHADVALPDDSERRIADALADPRAVAGAFRTWTVPDQRPSRLAPLLHLGDLRSRYSGLPYGDQALFVRAEAFRRVGGYPEQPLMEDLELARSLRRAGRIRIVPASVTVSGRRFLARPVYYFLLVNLMPLLYAAGVPPTRLARLYGDPR